MSGHSAEKVAGLTDAEWRAFPAIPDQGYSHRAWLDNLIRERMARAWDEGYASGHSNAMRRMSDEPNAPTTSSPYRPAKTDGAS